VVSTEPGIVLSYNKEFNELWKEGKEPDANLLAQLNIGGGGRGR